MIYICLLLLIFPSSRMTEIQDNKRSLVLRCLK